MARDVTASAMISRARELADMVTATPTTAFVTDVEALAQLNMLLGLWHGLLVKAVPERFEERETITANGAESYNLPWDHYLTLGVDYQIAPGVWWPLERIQYQDRTRFQTTTGGAAEGYYLKAATLVLAPAPSGGTYRHTYVKTAPVLLSAGSIDGVNGWEAWLVYGLAAFMVQKEESQATADALLGQQARVQAEIEAAATDREAATPMRIVDTRLKRY
jgi:hypothetical protein